MESLDLSVLLLNAFLEYCLKKAALVSNDFRLQALKTQCKDIFCLRLFFCQDQLIDRVLSENGDRSSSIDVRFYRPEAIYWTVFVPNKQLCDLTIEFTEL